MVQVETEKACYEVLSFIQEKWSIIQEEFDDYIAKPKQNGYKSLQVAIEVKPKIYCEIQMKTFEMHENNEFGPASHLGYKYGGKKTGLSSSKWIKELIDQKDEINATIGKGTQIKLFENEIFVFTPKGELITLPAKSTPVDFAYSIHTNIGNWCCGTKVNGKLVPLDTILKSGDTVEILTKRSHKPSSNWLDFVVTHEAKRNIRKFL